MNGKNRPLKISLDDNNRGRKSKQYIKDRLAAEKSMELGEHIFKPTEKILANKYAIAKWNELIRIFKDYQHVTNVDIGAMEQYCLTHAAYYELHDVKEDVLKQGLDPIDTYNFMERLKLDHNINKKLDMLIKLEDRLFLNPLARIRNIPKKEPKKEESELDKLGFSMV